MTVIIDTDVDVTPALPALKAVGVVSIGRYLDRLAPHESKVIKPAEARAIAAAGLRLFLIYEIGGRPNGSLQGKLDGDWVRDYLPTIGAPKGCSVFYTVDYDAPVADLPAISLAFRAFGRALADYRVGAYASGYVCNALFNRQLIELRWLTCSGGFAGTRQALADGAYELVQSLSPKIASLDVDVNRLRAPGIDFGDFVPFRSEIPAPPSAASKAPAATAIAPADTWLARFLERLRGH